MKPVKLCLPVFLYIFVIFQNYAQIRVATNGNVGVGTTSPSSKLHVNGSSYLQGTATITGAVVANSTIKLSPGNGSNDYLMIDQTASSGYGPATVIYPNLNNQVSFGKSSNAYKIAYCYSYTTPSDERQKENIRDIINPLNLITSLKGVKYDLKKEYFYSNDSIARVNTLSSDSKEEEVRTNYIGFIAQDVYEVIPEVVVYDDSTDIYAIDYVKLIPVLVEAIKSQDEKIKLLEQQVATLQKRR